MFQVRYFSANLVTIIHPPDREVAVDDLFETDLLFAWGDLADPHVVKEQLGRYVPFTWGFVRGYEWSTVNRLDRMETSLLAQPEGIVQGVILIGLTEQEYAVLDRFEQVPIHRHRDKITCLIGTIERIVNVYLEQGALLSD